MLALRRSNANNPNPVKHMTTDREQLAIGIDLGGTQVKFGIVRGDGTLLAFDAIDTPDVNDAQAMLRDIVNAVEQLEHAQELGDAPIGIGSAGLVDSTRGVIHRASNLPVLDDTPVAELVTAMTGRDVVIDNDANAAAFAEFKAMQQHCADVQNIAMILIGTGIGGGLVLDSKVRHGGGVAGELGHMIVVPDGRACPCGQRGCLERYTSASAICELAQEQFGDELPNGADTKQVMALAASGHAQAQALLNQTYQLLAISAVSLCRAVHLDAIIIGGGVASAGEPLRLGIEQAFHDQHWNLTPPCPIKLAQLGNTAGTIGAAMLAMRQTKNAAKPTP